MKRYYDVEDGLDEQRRAVGQIVVSAVVAFASRHQHELGDLAAEIAKKAALGQLGVAAGLIRTGVGTALREGRDTEPYWEVIDAIGNLHDSYPGAWPYMTRQDRERRLSWAYEKAKQFVDMGVVH